MRRAARSSVLTARRSAVISLRVVGACVALCVLLFGAPAHAATPTCAGKQATIVGTPGTDILTGTEANDVIVGGGGLDQIRGRGGDDVICAGDEPANAPPAPVVGEEDFIDAGDGND